MLKGFKSSIIISTACMLLATFLPVAQAEHYIVDSLEDVVAADGLVTLREAIEAANTNDAVNDAPAGSELEQDVISFDASLFAGGSATIFLNGIELAITDNLCIDGPLFDALVIDALDLSRAINILNNDTQVMLSGLTITGGYSESDGGGICNNGELDMMYCDVMGNMADGNGAGIYSTGMLFVNRCRVENNENVGDYSQAVGGGIAIDNGTFVMRDSSLSNNTCYSGGGLSLSYGFAMVYNSDINANNAIYVEVDDYTRENVGAGVYCERSSLYMENCEIRGNAFNTKGEGGGIYSFVSLITLIDSDVVDNYAETGGGIGSVGRELSLFNTLVSCNHGGYGIYSQYGETAISNSMITGNVGGGVHLGQSLLAIRNSTITGNSGYGIYSIDFLLLHNTIVAFNEFDIEMKDYYVRNPIVGIAPGFVRNPSAGPDGLWATSDDDLGDLHLAPTSIAINSGWEDIYPDDIPEFDFDGNERVFGSAIDIGAYEYIGEVSSEREEFSGTVTTVLDRVDSTDGFVSVREALFYDKDVDFAEHLAGGCIALEDGALAMIGDYTISSKDIGGITIDACGNSRVIESFGGSLCIDSVTITGGFSETGGGLFFSGWDLQLKNSVITGNTASDDGGGMAFGDCFNFLMENSVVSGNTSGGNGGGMYFNRSFETRPVIEVEIGIVNSVFVGNISHRPGGAIYVRDQNGNIRDQYDYVMFTITNSTITNNHVNADSRNGSGIYIYGLNAIVNNSIVAMNGNWPAENVQGFSYIFNSSLIGEDPLFVRNPYIGDDDQWGTADDDYGDLRLQAGSVAVDAGDDSLAVVADGDALLFDIAGAARIQGASVDIGAYERKETRADFNGDGYADVIDFIILKSNYGIQAGASHDQGDADGDGDVDIFDFLILKANYGKPV